MEKKNRRFLRAVLLMLALTMVWTVNFQAKEVKAAPQNGFVTENGKTYYYQNGQRHKGWLKLNGKTYYFTKNKGVMLRGWAKNSKGQYRYFSKGSGIMLTGWVDDTKGNRRYFTKGSGIMLTGWVDDTKGRRRYFTKGKGIMARGWLRNSKGDKRYFTRGSGAMSRGWLQDSKGNIRYFDKESGIMKTGMWELEGNWYQFDSKGIVCNEMAQIVLHGMGKVKNTRYVAKGGYFRFPAMANTADAVFLGYSAGAGQKTVPQYEAGDRVAISGKIEFYAVFYEKQKETDLPYETIVSSLSHAKQKYNRIMFVGDSRTVRMKYAIQNQIGNAGVEGVSFICEGAQGLEWLKVTAYPELIRQLDNQGDGTYSPTAVVFNLGVNDFLYIDKYLEFMREIQPELERRNCRLFYMSVNPVNSENLKQVGLAVRREEDIRTFNKRIQNELTGYEYIDVYNQLLRTGFTYDSGYGSDNGLDDGLHYSTRTYKRIYDFALNYIATH